MLKKKAVGQHIGFCPFNFFFSRTTQLEWSEHSRSDKAIYATNTYVKANTSVTNVQ